MNSLRLQIREALTIAKVFEGMFCKQKKEKAQPNGPTTQDTSQDTSPRTGESSSVSLRTEKIKVLAFFGDVKTFAKFQRPIKKIVIPAYPDKRGAISVQWTKLLCHTT